MDNIPIGQSVILFLLIILSGVFSSTETAYTTVSESKLKALQAEGNKRAGRVLRLKENTTKLLSAILIGNNIVNLSASALATTVCTKTFGNAYIGVATGILTFLILIFGEITPKTIASTYCTGLAIAFSGPLSVLMFILTPIIWLLNIICRGIFLLLRLDPDKNPNQMTESELRVIVDTSEEDGVIEKSEKKMITNVVDFGDALSKDIMIPRADMVAVNVNTDYKDLIELLKNENYSRLPIYEESKDHIIGILHMKDLFMAREAAIREGKTNESAADAVDIKRLMRKPVFVYEYQKTAEIFADLKVSSSNMCIVLDEYGITAGLITMEDLIEEIVGDIRDEYDSNEDEFIRKQEENVYDVMGAVKIDDLNDAIGTKLHSDNYDSVGGLVIELLDRLPAEGDVAENDEVSIKVLRIEKRRVEKVRLQIKKNEEEEGAS